MKFPSVWDAPTLLAIPSSWSQIRSPPPAAWNRDFHFRAARPWRRREGNAVAASNDLHTVFVLSGFIFFSPFTVGIAEYLPFIKFFRITAACERSNSRGASRLAKR